MGSGNVAFHAFNRGEISRSALARVDIERLRLAAEVQENWMPFVIGMMTLRPGLAHIGSTLNNSAAQLIDFVFGKDDTALLELTPSVMRVWDGDELVARVAVDTAVTNGDFSSDTGWTLTASAGASATISGGKLNLHARAVGSSALCERSVSVAVGDQGKVHAARIEVERGPVNFRIFSSGVSYEFTDNAVDPTVITIGGGTSTLTDVAIGTASAERRVVIGIGSTNFSSFAPTITSVTIGGITATAIGTTTGSFGRAALYVANVPTGTTATVEVVYSSTSNGTGIGVWAIYGLASDTHLDFKTSTADPGATTLNVEDGGVAIAYSVFNQSGTDSVWTNASERFDEQLQTVDFSSFHSGADAATTDGTLAISNNITGSPSSMVTVAVSFPGDVDNVEEQTLGTGTHSIAFTPTTDVTMRLSTLTKTTKIIDSITIEAAGDLTLPTPWGADDLDNLRWTQSGDIVFVACEDFQPRKIERRAGNSWSVVKYENQGGPFVARPEWAGEITITPVQGIGGTQTLTASRDFFTPSHVGALIRGEMTGQSFAQAVAGDGRYTEPIRVSGAVQADRQFTWTPSGTWSGTLSLERSIDGPDAGFVEVSDETSNATYTNNDTATHANVVAWYRVGFRTTEYTSGSATITFAYEAGGGAGIARIVEYNSSTSVDIEILKTFPNTTPTKEWTLGAWSDIQGWPTSVSFFDGRLWWAGLDQIWGSISDDYMNFDVEAEGDSAPISRSIGFGPIARINWLLPLARLIAGREMSESSIRSSSFDEPITPTQLTIKDCSTQGSAPIQAVRVDKRGIFVQQSNRKIYDLAFSAEQLDYIPRDLTRLNLDIGLDGFSDMTVQRQPDTQIRIVRDDGQLVSLLYEPEEEVEAFWRVVTDGEIERARVLPGDVEDQVYCVVKRTIDGSDVRYIEKFARYDQCRGQPEGRLADSHILYSGVATTTITGLSHLEGETVVVWGWNTDSPFTVTLPGGTVVTVGRDLGTYTVSGGQITGLTASVTDACVGLGYTAKFKSAKLAYAASRGTAVNQIKRLDSLGVTAIDTHYQGLQHGPDFTNMDNLPLVESGKTTEDHTIWPEIDFKMMEHPGEYDTDSRLCLQAAAPRPCTLLGTTIGVETHDH